MARKKTSTNGAAGASDEMPLEPRQETPVAQVKAADVRAAKAARTSTPTIEEDFVDADEEDLDDDLDEDEDEDEDEDVEDDDDDDDDDDDETGPDAAAAAPEPIKTYDYKPTRYLKHDFTPEEINGFRADREEKDRIIDVLQAELDEHKISMKHLRKRIETLAKQGRELSKRVRDGSEMRNVGCEERKELDPREDSPTFGKLMMLTYRLDTMEIIEARELKGVERQGVLFDDAPAKTPAVGNEFREAAPGGE